MTTQEAITNLDNLRRAVLTVQGPNGPTAINGADHDIFREAIQTLRAELSAVPTEKGQSKEKS